MLLNLLILPVLVLLGAELVIFIKLAAKYRSGKIAWALLLGLVLFNFALYEGVLYVWPGSYLDRYQHDEQAKLQNSAGTGPAATTTAPVTAPVPAPVQASSPATPPQQAKPAGKTATKSGH